MKKSSLTTAVVAGIAGVAGLVNVSNALNVNPDGLGQVLIYPYYTVNGGNSTLLSVVNTTDDVKAVKVRFLEGRNSQEVLDFNLYLSPFDVWTGAVIDRGNGAGPAYLITNDNSCTVPRIKGNPLFPNGVPFVNYEYADNNDDGGPYILERTREGHVEMIEMGRVVNNGDVSAASPSPTVGSTSAIDRQTNPAGFTAAALATAAVHNQTTGIPNNCTLLENAWRPGGIWATNANLDIDTPNGGLFGAGAIIDTANGTNLSYNPDAIEGFFVSESFQNLHANPGTVDPTLADAQSSDSGETTAVIFENGDLITQTYTGLFAGRDAVSAVFMHNEIYNEYNTTVGIDADSEWVITFPTKRLHVEEGVVGNYFNKLPFTSDYLGDSAPYTDLIGACETINVAFYNREEKVPGQIPTDLGFSPPPPNVEAPGLTLCYEAQVVTFNQPTVGEVLFGDDPSAVLGSSFARNLNLCQTYNPDGSCQGALFNEGWLRMELGNGINNFLPVAPGGEDPETGENVLVGLPATGFWAANYVNAGAQPGLLANYSGLHKHRGDREAVVATVQPGTAPLWTFTEFTGSVAPAN